MTKPRRIGLLGAPLDFGASQLGTGMGPASLRTAGLVQALAELGQEVRDFGDARADALPAGARFSHQRMKNLDEAAAWTRSLRDDVLTMLRAGWTPVIMGGDHSITLGTGAAAAEHAHDLGRELFLLWLDAHPDFNTFETSPTGNMHGTPVAFLCGLPGFDGLLDQPFATPIDPANVTMLGIRSVDPGERRLLAEYGLTVHDMRTLHERGIACLLAPFLDRAARRNGLLHVSLDVDFLDPDIAPGAGTAVPGGATFREARLIMQMLHDSGLVTSLEVAELNPVLDEGGRTARLLVDLTASLFGRTMGRLKRMP